MTTIELEARKTQLIKSILDIDSEALLTKAEAYINKLKSKNPPCQYTEEELKIRVRQSVEDAKNGLGISQEDMRKRHVSL